MSDLCPVAVAQDSAENEYQPETAVESHLLLLKQKKYCDVTFTFSNLPNRIPAHEVYLKARSPVFAKIFRMRKSGNVEGNDIEISESTPEIFQQFLEFIYVDKFEVDITGALDLLHLAQKYKVNLLIKKCERLLLTEILIKYSVKIFETARRYGRRELMDRAGQTMVKSFLELTRSDALANAEEETFIYLLERDDLAVKEVGLFQFILNWGRNRGGTPTDQEVLRRKLKNLISKIRYTNMDPNEFTKVVVPTGLLSAEESLSVYSFLCGDEITRRQLEIKFNTSPRKGGKMRTVFFATTEVAPKYFIFDNGYESVVWNPPFYKQSISFQVDRAQVDGKLLPDYLLRKTVITKVKIWTPDVHARYKEHHVLHLNVLIGDYAGPVQSGSFTIRFQKNILNWKKTCWNDISVEPPLELMSGRTYSVIVENLSTVELVDTDGFYMDPMVYYAARTSNLKRNAHVNLEEVSVTLKEIHIKTDYFNQNLPKFSEELVLIRGVEIGLN